MIDNKFSWVETHRQITEFLITKENSQIELIELLKSVGIGPFNDKANDGEHDVELDEIDPFTFFCYIYKYGSEKRLKFLQEISRKINVLIPLGESGIPSAQAQKVWLFPYKYLRKNNEVARLWSFFHKTLENKITDSDFEDILKIKNTGKIKLTEALFDVNPEKYLPINGPTKEYLKEVHNIDINFETYTEYVNLLDKIKNKINLPFYIISYDAWRWIEEKKIINYWVFQGNPQIFDIVSALNDNNLKTWMVNAHKKSIKEGDKIILWLTGKNSGCYALGEVTSEVYYGVDDDTELKYYLKNEENEESDRVNIRITHNLSKNPILKTQISHINELRNLKGGFQGTNFKSNEIEYNAFFKLIESMENNFTEIKNNYKEDYIVWLNTNFINSSGTRSSYIRAIEVLSDILKKDIFSISNLKVLSDLYDDLLEHQKEDNGKYYYKGAIAYGKKGFYSAAIKSLIMFHQKNNQLDKPISKKYKVNSVFSKDIFYKNCIESYLYLQNNLITRFTSSLLTKPFVILTGLSGSGKTKLAQAFAMWLCENDTQYKIVPVGADWTNREPLLGFPNGLDSKTYVTPDSGALDLITSAIDNPEKPYFLILDEMNLSHVERYFADFLSVMESKEKVKLYSGAERISSNETPIPAEIAWPKNLFIVGTVNIDETTYMFSPKVLDRANVIEFRVTDMEMESYLVSAKQLDMESLKAGGAAMAADFVRMAKADTVQITEEKEINNALLAFFKELKKSGAEFGYRSASEILRFAGVAKTIEPVWKVDDVIDAAVMQKLLPKVHGSRNKLSKILPVLGGFCLVNPEKIKDDYLERFDSVDFENDANIKYKLSFEKICRMYRNAIENGYASYAEA